MQASDEENAVSGQPVAAAAVRGRKMYYSISEVCAMTGIGQHVLRYWEKEFSLLHPKKNSGGKRAYKEKDIESIVKIKRMLDEEKYTLQGAKEKLLDERRGLRAGGGAAAKKRGKTVAADGEKKRDLADSSVLEPDTSSTSPIPADTAAKSTKRKSIPNKNNGRGINSHSNNYSDDDKALLLHIRTRLSEVLGLLE